MRNFLPRIVLALTLGASVSMSAPSWADTPAATEQVEGGAEALDTANDATAPTADALTANLSATESEALTLVDRYAPWMHGSFLGREIWQYTLALLVFAFGFLLRIGILKSILAWAGKLAERTKNEWDDAVIEAAERPLDRILFVTAIYAALLCITVRPEGRAILTSLWRATTIALIGWAGVRMLHPFAGVAQAAAESDKVPLNSRLIAPLHRLARVVVIMVTIVVLLQEIGYDVGGLLAGLGVASAAIALAAQDTLENWFGSLMIYTDRPFDVGDWIKTNELEGVVEEIGLRSTRVRTFGKTLVSVPNGRLATATIENFSRMPRRRVTFTLGVTYSTTPAMMLEAVERVKDILRTTEGIAQDFWLVKFNEFSDSSLNILVYFFTDTTDWGTYLDIRQSVNLQVMEAFGEIGVEAAFPSQSIYMEKPDAARIAELDEKARALYAARPDVNDEMMVTSSIPSEEG